MLELTTPVQYVKGIGPKLAEILATKGITTVGDLLNYLPFGYKDGLMPRGLGEWAGGKSAGADAKAPVSLEVGRPVPLYESAGKGRGPARWFRRVIRTALDDLTPDLP